MTEGAKRAPPGEMIESSTQINAFGAVSIAADQARIREQNGGYLKSSLYTPHLTRTSAA
jgi:hypothetical protein